MSQIKSHLHLALSSIKCFTDDGRLDENEINFLMGLALADNVIDADEKRVLASIFDKALQSKHSASTARHIAEIRAKHSF